MQLKTEEYKGIPQKWLSTIIEYLSNFRNGSVDLNQPILRSAVEETYPLFIFLYVLVIVVGTCSNIAVICTVIRRKLYLNPTFCFVINLAVSDIVKCVVVLPVTLTILLIQNWIFGSFLCFFLPMLQVSLTELLLLGLEESLDLFSSTF